MIARRLLMPCTLCFLLAGCGGAEHGDLDEFMNAPVVNREKMPPLPSVIPPDTFEYNSGNVQDPFLPKSMRPAMVSGGFQPDFNRPKERLEEFPLDALKMVGTLKKQNKMTGVVKDPEGGMHRVVVGNRIGQNFGVIKGVTEAGLEIQEITQDSSGNWSKSMTRLATPVQE